MKTIKTVAGLIAYTLLCLIACLLIAEAYFRFDNAAYLRGILVAFDPPVYEPSDTLPYTLAKNIDYFQFRRGEYFAHDRTNSQGLREDRLIQIPKPKNTFRILTVGDSYIFGYGVERDRLFQAVAEKILEERHPDFHIEVVDMGFAAAGSLDARYVYVRDVALAYQPDAVIVDLNYSSDPGRMIENQPYSEYDSNGLPKAVHYTPIVINPNTHLRSDRFEFETIAAGQIVLPSQFPLPELGAVSPAPNVRDSIHIIRTSLHPFDSTRICSAIRLCMIVQKYLELRALKDPKTGLDRTNIDLLPAAPSELGQQFTDYPGQDENGFPVGSDFGEGWQMSKPILRGMRDFLEERNIKFGVLMVPYPSLVDFDPSLGNNQVATKYYKADSLAAALSRDKPTRVFGGFMRDNRIPFLHPLREMHEERLRTKHPLYFSFDEHWNEDGHAVLGKLVADWIENNGWIEPNRKAN